MNIGADRWNKTDIDISVVSNDTYLVTKSGDNKMLVIDGNTGKTEWRAKSTTGMRPFMASSSVICAVDAQAGSIHILDRFNGDLLLELERISSMLVASPSVFGYIQTWEIGDNPLSLFFIMNTASSNPKPKLIYSSNELAAASYIPSSGDRLYFSDDRHLRMVDVRRGEAGWVIQKEPGAGPAEAGGVLYLVSGMEVHGIDRQSGKVVWKREFSNRPELIAHDESGVYVVSADRLTKIGVSGA